MLSGPIVNGLASAFELTGLPWVMSLFASFGVYAVVGVVERLTSRP